MAFRNVYDRTVVGSTHLSSRCTQGPSSRRCTAPHYTQVMIHIFFFFFFFPENAAHMIRAAFVKNTTANLILPTKIYHCSPQFQRAKLLFHTPPSPPSSKCQPTIFSAHLKTAPVINTTNCMIQRESRQARVKLHLSRLFFHHQTHFL